LLVKQSPKSGLNLVKKMLTHHLYVLSKPQDVPEVHGAGEKGVRAWLAEGDPRT